MTVRSQCVVVSQVGGERFVEISAWERGGWGWGVVVLAASVLCHTNLVHERVYSAVQYSTYSTV